MIDDQEVIYFYLFVFNFSNNMLVLFFKCALASAIERKIVLASDSCFKPSIIIKFHKDCVSK